jgi:hypothetical protein
MPQHAAATRAIDDSDRLAKLLLEENRHHPGDPIRAAACCPRDDELDGAAGHLRLG